MPIQCTQVHGKWLSVINKTYTSIEWYMFKVVPSYSSTLNKINIWLKLYFFHFVSSSSSPFPTRWGQWPKFLISIMFCPGHPPGWSTFPACPFGRNPPISLLVFSPALPCQQLLSLTCSLPFSGCDHTSVVSFLWLSLLCYSLLDPSFFTLSLSVTPLILLNILIWVLDLFFKKIYVFSN